MKKSAVAVFVLAISAASASAADMAPRYAKAPPMVPVSTWTGCYVGGNVGAGWSPFSIRDGDPSAVGPAFDAGSHTASGVVGGGQIGCDYQFASNWVLGVQGMIDGSGVRGSHLASLAYAGDNNETFSSKVNWFGTATVRLGYVLTPQTLLYAKGGAAWVPTAYSDVDPNPANHPPFSGTASTTRTGWTAGVGAEYKFSPNWSVFAEYNYIGLGTKNLPFSYTCVGGCNFPNPYRYSVKQDFQTFLVGVNYRFSSAY
jgi:outer membrane immunogenic protein